MDKLSLRDTTVIDWHKGRESKNTKLTKKLWEGNGSQTSKSFREKGNLCRFWSEPATHDRVGIAFSPPLPLINHQ